VTSAAAAAAAAAAQGARLVECCVMGGAFLHLCACAESLAACTLDLHFVTLLKAGLAAAAAAAAQGVHLVWRLESARSPAATVAVRQGATTTAALSHASSQHTQHGNTLFIH
jgi:hypothetical protein